MGLLSRYSLTEEEEGTDSHSMHSVLHRWCGHLVEKDKQHELGCLAARLVALSVPLQSDALFWMKRRRVMSHGLRVSKWIGEGGGSDKQRMIEGPIWPGHLHNLGYLLADEDRQRAVQMYQRALQGREKAWGPEHTSTLDTVNNLAALYKDLGQLDEAEKMYQRALEGKQKAWGLEHTSTLDTVNNLGAFYAILGRLDKAEKMYQQALEGKEKAWGPEHISTLNTVNNLGLLYANQNRLDKAEKMLQRALDGYARAISLENLMTYLPALINMWAFASLRESQDCVKDAKHWYSQALLGYEKTFGLDYDKCRSLRTKLELLVHREEE
jgi:tetratricopeptide (TPR) repeat protein